MRAAIDESRRLFAVHRLHVEQGQARRGGGHLLVERVGDLFPLRRNDPNVAQVGAGRIEDIEGERELVPPLVSLERARKSIGRAPSGCQERDERQERQAFHVRSPRRMNRWVRNETTSNEMAIPMIEPTR